MLSLCHERDRFDVIDRLVAEVGLAIRPSSSSVTTSGQFHKSR